VHRRTLQLLHHHPTLRRARIPSHNLSQHRPASRPSRLNTTRNSSFITMATPFRD
jgi:hypothetical protein